LTEVVALEQRTNTKHRFQQWVGGLMGAAFLIAGAYAGFVRVPPSVPYPAALVIMVIGLLVGGYSLWYRSPSRFPDYVDVSTDGLRFGWLSRQDGVNFDFGSPRCRFTLFDRSRTSPPKRAGQLRPAYRLLQENGRAIPLTPEAFTSILDAVTQGQLGISRKELTFGLRSSETLVRFDVTGLVDSPRHP
jgi:hypothetical protein